MSKLNKASEIIITSTTTNLIVTPNNLQHMLNAGRIRQMPTSEIAIP